MCIKGSDPCCRLWTKRIEYTLLSSSAKAVPACMRTLLLSGNHVVGVDFVGVLSITCFIVNVASLSRSLCLRSFPFLTATASESTSSRPCRHMLRRLRGLAQPQCEYCTHIQFSLISSLDSLWYLLPLQNQVFLPVSHCCLLYQYSQALHLVRVLSARVVGSLL